MGNTRYFGWIVALALVVSASALLNRYGSATVAAASLKCDADADGDIDQDDLVIVRNANNQPAAGAADPRDGNSDGAINVADVRYCSLRLAQAAHLIIKKVVVNDQTGTLTAADFSGTFTGVTSAAGATWQGAVTDRRLTTVGAYQVLEPATAGYEARFSEDCAGTIALAQTKTCTVTNVAIATNRPPRLAPMTDRRVPAGAPLQFRVSADDPDIGDALTFTLSAGPSGAALAVGPTLSWTPGVGDIGVHPFSIRVQDRAGLSDSGDFNVEVVAANGAPVLDAQADGTTSAGVLYQRSITAMDPDPGDTISYALVSGPAGLAISTAGALSWQPTSDQLGAHAVKVTATDSTGLSDAAAFTISVEVLVMPPPPIAVDDQYAVRRATTLTVPAPGVLENDIDHGRPLIARLVTAPTKGVLALQPNGSLTYRPTDPALGSTEPKLDFAYAPGGGLVATYGQPIVVDLDKDGKPEIVFISWGAFGVRRLIAVHGVDGTTAFSVNAFQPAATPPIVVGDGFSELAAGDLDGDGFPEIIAVDAHDGTPLDGFRRSLLAFNHDGTHRWTSQDVVDGPLIDSTSGFAKPAIADLDGDGTPEIIVGYAGRGPLTPAGVVSEDYVTVFDNLGHMLWTARGGGTRQGSPTATAAVVADIDLDGRPEILFSDDTFDNRGLLVRSVADVNLNVSGIAVANLDDDPFAETVYLDRFGRLHVYEHTGAKKWGPVTPPGTESYGLGLPAVGDVDGDGRPEIVVVRDETIAVMRRDGSVLREIALPQIGYGGNVTIFDLNGDGNVELIYQSARGPFDTGSVNGALYIFDSQTGALLHALQAPRNGADDQRGPLVADVDGDGSAEIVTGGWGESKLMHVFGAKNGRWAQTRPVWNQFGYHVTNVNADGTIPAREPINWLTPGLNNFFVNVPLPEERTGDRDVFTYTASDGALDSNVATVRLDILPANTAPRILSVAPQGASPGIEYLYAVRAVDPDIGEALTYSLLLKPAGMTIDGSSGLVRWTPAEGASGPVTLVVAVVDSQGQSDSQHATVTVAAPTVVPDVVGNTDAGARAALAVAGLITGAVATSPSSTVPVGQIVSQEPGANALVAAGTGVDLVVSTGPAPVTVPYLVGKTESAASARLTALGLATVVGRVFSNTVPDGQVVSQDPVAGARVVAGSVSLTVSAGSGLSLRLHSDLTTADVAIPFTAAAYDLSYADVPPPPLTYAVTPAITPHFGGLPTVVGSTVVPALDTGGAFRLTATDPVTGRSASVDFAVTFRHVAGERSMADAFSGMGEALVDIDRLARQGRAALAVNDAPAIASVLDQIVQRWRQVDSFEILLATPFGLPEGYFPAPSDLPSLGLTPTADDLLAQQVLKDVKRDLDAWIEGLRESSTSMTTLEVLADRFNASAARLQTLTLSEWGVIKGQPLITAIVSDRLPVFYTALTDDLARVVGLSASAGGPRPSTLAEQVATVALKHVVDKVLEASSPIFKARSTMLKAASWAAGAVMAARRFKTKVQGQELAAVVAGASLSFRVFRADYSFVEADVDTDVVENNVVIMIGPDQVAAADPDLEEKLVKEVLGLGEAPEEVLNAIDNQNRLYDALMKTYGWLKSGDAAGVADAVGGAFQGRGTAYKGCLFSSSPTCGQLVFLDGFKPVYTVSRDDAVGGFTGIPVPILVLVYNKTTGVLFVDTPVFLPAVD